jgi:hypothetical protein
MRVFYTVFFFLSALLFLPSDSKASIPAEVIKVGATVTGAAVTVGGVSAIIPASAVAGVPSVGTASAASGVVTVPAIVPVTVGGIALAGGYAVGASLVTDIPAIRNMVESLPDKYQALKDAFATEPDPSYVPTYSIGDVASAKDGATGLQKNYKVIGPPELGGTCIPTSVLPDGTCKGWPPIFGYVYGRPLLQTWTYKINPSTINYLAEVTSLPATPLPTSPPLTDAEAASNMSNPDGSLIPSVDADLKGAIAAGDLAPSGINVAGGESGSVTGITPELMQLYSRMLAAQNATDVAAQSVQQLQDALSADPTNATLSQQLDQAQNDLAEAQRQQAAADAAAAEAQTAADTATANLGTANTYDSSITAPALKNITGLMDSFFNNSPLIGIVRSFQISTYDQQAIFSFGTFWDQEITVDFTRWQSVLAGCGVVLLVLSHAYAVFIVVRG